VAEAEDAAVGSVDDGRDDVAEDARRHVDLHSNESKPNDLTNFWCHNSSVTLSDVSGPRSLLKFVYKD